MTIHTLKSGQQLIIRDARPEEAAAIIQYVQQIGDESNFLTFEGKEFNKTVEEEASIIQDHLDTINKLFIVAEVNGQIVGMLNAGGKQKPRLRHVIEFGVSVKKEFWNQSIARLLIEHLINWGKTNPIIKKINLMCVEHNTNAIGLYEKLGFEHEGRLRMDFFHNGKYYDGIAMGMIL